MQLYHQKDFHASIAASFLRFLIAPQGCDFFFLFLFTPELTPHFWQNSYDQTKLWSYICLFTLKSLFHEVGSSPFKHNLVTFLEINYNQFFFIPDLLSPML